MLGLCRKTKKTALDLVCEGVLTNQQQLIKRQLFKEFAHFPEHSLQESMNELLFPNACHWFVMCKVDASTCEIVMEMNG